MEAIDLMLAAAAGAVSLAISATLWALAQRRRSDARVRTLQGRLEALEGQAGAAFASAEAFDSAVITVEAGAARFASGAESLEACARALGLSDPEPQAIVEALTAGDPEQGRRLTALFDQGEACAFEARGPHGVVSVEGRTGGALAWLRLTALDMAGGTLPTAARFAAFVDARVAPAWIASADGTPVWANRAWLAAAEAESVEDAVARGLSFDRGAEPLIVEAVKAGERREAVRRVTVAGQRRAFRILAAPLEGGGAGAWAEDVTEAEDARETLKQHGEAHAETLNHLADAVAIFSRDRRLSFHNTAFANLWGLEPAFLDEGPTHGEVLDRLRQRRRLPETADYAAWKQAELAWYEALSPAPDDLWHLPDGRTLRVVRQPHPLGGLLLIFSDITGELRMKAQYNALIQVHQATLDKLNDAVAVFGSDGRLRLFNEAFARFWNSTPADIEAAGGFDGVVQICTPRLHDLAFWRDLKARIADPDPTARIAVGGEARTSDDRIVAWQTRPLPDGATLVGFADVTDTKRLERALQDRSAALAEAEALKRDFVGNVSYELRTPLTTIIGYSELLEYAGDAIPERMRGHVASVRAAATQLARSIDDVLDMAQIDAGEMALNIGDVRLPELMGEAAGHWTRQAEVARVTIEVVGDEAAAPIRADGRRLGQCLDHLIENALRESTPGAVVTLSAERVGGEVQVKVADTGRGIPFHVQATIFDRFADRARGGPGLGLALVKSLVELHGGWVALESEPGKGSTFTLHLPDEAHADTSGAQREMAF